MTLDSEDSASVESTLKSIFANPEGTNDTFTFHDVIKMIKDGDDWKITDIVRDGKSLKKQWKKIYCGDGIAA